MAAPRYAAACSVVGCEKRQARRGFCHAHYRAKRATGELQNSPRGEAAFWAKVDKTASGCWLWTAAKNASGYGCFGIPGGRGAACLAHRYSYLAHRGVIPAEFHLDHLCRVPSCVNPDHLEPVSPRENMLRAIASRNGDRDTCKRGHALTGDNVYLASGNRRVCRNCQAGRMRERRASEAVKNGPV